MKTIKFIILSALISFAAISMAQTKITINDVYNGQSVTQFAKEHAVKAFIATKPFYKDGTTEEAFVNQCFNNFPSKYADLRDAYMPYAKYLYSLHKRGLTEDEVRKITTGKEFVDTTNQLIAWKKDHPGEVIEGAPWWRKTISFLAEFFTWLDEILPE